MKTNALKIRLAIGRFLIGVVTFFNLQASIQFMLAPERYAPGFELTGVPGESIIQGMGLLFLMWNVPYLVALIHPLRYLVSLVEAVLMQAIGVVGETILLVTLRGNHDVIHASITRFIIFDGGGLILLFAALGLMLALKTQQKAVVT